MGEGGGRTMSGQWGSPRGLYSSLNKETPSSHRHSQARPEVLSLLRRRLSCHRSRDFLGSLSCIRPRRSNGDMQGGGARRRRVRAPLWRAVWSWTTCTVFVLPSSPHSYACFLLSEYNPTYPPCIYPSMHAIPLLSEITERPDILPTRPLHMIFQISFQPQRHLFSLTPFRRGIFITFCLQIFRDSSRKSSDVLVQGGVIQRTTTHPPQVLYYRIDIAYNLSIYVDLLLLLRS